MCIALAIGGSAVVGAAGSAVAGSEAAGATKDASKNAINQQNAALQQEAALSQPYRDLGSAAIGQYEKLLGIGPGGAGDIQATLAATPGYQFAKTEGLQATENQATAMGMGLSGNTLRALDTFSTGLADSTYQQAVGNIQGAVGIGQAAAAGQAANVQNAANNISSYLIAQGNNIAGIDANTIAGISKAATGAAGDYVTLSTLKGLS